jgi:hypothetical protein
MLLSVWYFVFLLEGSFLFENHHAWTNSYFYKPSWTLRLQTNLHVLARQNLTVSPLLIQKDDSKRELRGDNNIYLNKEDRRTRQRTNGLNMQVSGEQRALRQVGAIMDLYNMTNPGVSAMIVSKALEGLIQRVSHNQTVDGALLAEIEELFWRLKDMPAVLPTYLSVETLWMMQQRYYQQSQLLCGKHIGRSVHLLMNWFMWANNNNNQQMPLYIPKPPDEFIYSTFSLAKESNVGMSFRMWDLYRHLHLNVPEALSRDFYSLVLDVLSKSPASWKACSVLQDLERRYQSSGDLSMTPSNAELENTLVDASRYGRAADATWIFRMLRARQSKSQMQAHHKLWFQALRKSSEPGSAVYLEQLLLSSFEATTDESTTDDYNLYLLMRHRIYYNMVLQKWSTMKTPGAGMRAQALFNRMVTKYQTSGDEKLRPNEESVHHVVMAFVREKNASLQHLLDAHRFLRQSLQSLGSLRDRTNTTNTRQWRTFHILLESYTKYPDDRLAVEGADRLFRFFLLQHRDGMVSEEPDPFHLSHTLKAWHKSPNMEGATKSLEFFRLLDSLYHQGTIQLQPDAYNIRQLLETVAQSDLSGQGEYAESLLARVLESDALPPSFDATAVGTLFHHVIKCNCNDRTEEGLYRARKILEALQDYHSENPLAVRLSGAPYITLINKWANLGGARAGEQVHAILEDFESQYFAGNKDIKLSWKIYADAIKAWTKDASPNVIRKVDELDSRWNELCQQGIHDVSPHPIIDLAVALAHASCPDGSLEKAEQILMDMNSRFEAGDGTARVSSHAWHALLEGISKRAPEEECLARSQSIFDKMKQQDRNGQPVADLRCWAYEALMRSWSRSGDPAALSEMENIYSSLMERYKGGSSQLQPSSVFVDLLLEKYNEEESPEDDEVAEKALALFQEATKEFRDGNTGMKPGRSTVWLVLAALGRSGQSSKYEKVVEEVIQWRDEIF